MINLYTMRPMGYFSVGYWLELLYKFYIWVYFWMLPKSGFHKRPKEWFVFIFIIFSEVLSLILIENGVGVFYDFLFVSMRLDHASRLSRYIPRSFTDCSHGICLLLMYTRGQSRRGNVEIMWDYSLIFIIHFINQYCNRLWWFGVKELPIQDLGQK